MAAKKRKPVGVVFTDGSYRRFGSVAELALELGIHRETVRLWINKRSKPLAKHGVKSVGWLNE